ncbi:molybdopterin-dependent oxidoreductase [Halorussus gelatinilyticus]|uniref:Molybdopterin-dependent oxidoreductase n=1 Tax=Halorussus gelatinilyticus TaxID=2937524 RepID=A0A8U0INS4_9EURY|nr:molybdopterin-dependent oxidoreductase [Halorussus gelatinilyticus]UPW01814.1 molybdopterin-dependent oxidoreductase [Halorussus gelatinilyticus]
MNVSHAETATAASAGVCGVAGSFAVAGRTPEFVVAPVAALVVDFTPGVVTTAAIRGLGDWGHRLALGVALALTAGILAGVAFGAVRVGGRSEVPYTSVAAGGVASWLLTIAATGAPKASLAVAGPVAAVLAVGERGWAVGRDGRRSRVSTSRRKVLAALGAVAGFAGFSAYRGADITGVEPGPVADVTSEAVQREADDMLARATERSLGVSGLSGLVTPTDEFYEVDVNNVNPNPSDGKWDLSVTGEVETSLTLDFEELTATTVENRFVTLRCVGEALNGRKMDTAVWTGVPVRDLLDEATPRGSGACCVLVRAVDGYYQEFPLGALEESFLAVGMNGRRLPRGHGYPVRLLVPGHWGEINVKWVSEIEVLDEEHQGYWEKRGWHGTGPVNTVAKLHAVNRPDDASDDTPGDSADESAESPTAERIEVAGHAYAGTRGIRKVEVSTDGGETWADADLSKPLAGEDVWRQWRYAWDAEPGDHEVVVRATDGEGNLQPEEFAQPFPSGATGWVSRTVEV